MRDQGLSPVAVTCVDGRIAARTDVVWDMEAVIGGRGENAFYLFESAFDPYAEYARRESDKIDLVIAVDGSHFAPREIKLTVVPDSATVSDSEGDWGPELVMRPVSSAHAMMSIGSNLARNPTVKDEVVEALKPAYNQVDGWDNVSEIATNASLLADSLDAALRIAEPLQRPFLIQPIWKTQGQSLELCDRCFDVFTWSDVAVLRIPVDRASVQVSRTLRECARHTRGLFELLTIGSYSYEAIYKGMSLGSQTDKSYSVNGKVMSKYLQHSRLRSPRIARDSLTEIVLNDGERELRPERRFDAAVVAHMLRSQR